MVAPGVYKPNRSSLPLVDTVSELLQRVPEPRVADVGAGSGALGISVAMRCPHAHVYLLDVSAAAVACAAENANRVGAVNVETLTGSLLVTLRTAVGVMPESSVTV